MRKYSDYSVKCSSKLETIKKFIFFCIFIFLKKKDPEANLKETGNVYELIIQPEKILDLDLVFSPTEVL